MSLTISSLAALLLTQFLGETVDSEQIASFFNIVGLIVTAIGVWYGHFRQGDINWWGGKK